MTKLPNVLLLVVPATRDSTPACSVLGLGGLSWRLAKGRTKARLGHSLPGSTA